MLNASETVLVMRAAKALRGHGDSALAAELDDALLASEQARASVATGQAKRRSGERGRAPSTLYAVEVEPGWMEQCVGAKAAHAALAAALTKLGSKRAPPSEGSMAVQLSRGGAWATLVDTDNGTVSITVTKLARELQNAGTVPKREKRR